MLVTRLPRNLAPTSRLAANSAGNTKVRPSPGSLAQLTAARGASSWGYLVAISYDQLFGKYNVLKLTTAGDTGSMSCRDG